MTTLICDFQDIVGKKIDGYATLTAGKVRPSYDSPSLVVHNPTKQRVDAGQTTFVNVNPGEAVITLEWDEQSATIRFVVPESDDAVYLSDTLSGEYLDPDELELLRWSVQNQLSGAREILENAKNLGLTAINGSTEAYFTEAAEILRKALEAAHLAESYLGTIDGKVAATEGAVTDASEARERVESLLEDMRLLQIDMDNGSLELETAINTVNEYRPQVEAATQAVAEATALAESAVDELMEVQDRTAAEFLEIKQTVDTAVRESEQATKDLALANQAVANEVQRILGEVAVSLDTAAEATNQARIANDNLETYQFQMTAIQEEQGHILSQQAEIVGNYGNYNAELERISSEIATASSELDTISEEQTALVTEMNKKVGSLDELTAAQGAAIGTAKARADKGVNDAAAASNALSNYKKVNDPKVVAAQNAADQAKADATSKSKAAREAAEEYAREAAEAAQAQAEETAAAEALRVAQAEATAAKNSAATDAQAKADEAERLAKIHADAQAKSAKETAEANAAKDASTKADKAKTDAQAAAKVLSDKAQQAAEAAQKRADKGVTDAATAKARADKGVTDAATALAKANEANNRLPAITSDVSAAAKSALDAINALPGIRTDISTAKQRADKGVSDASTAKTAADTAQKRADKGVADAKAVADKIPDINTKISNLTKDQTTLGSKAQQGIDDAKVAADLVKNRVEIGTSLVALIPGTNRPRWSEGLEEVRVTDLPGVSVAYKAPSTQTTISPSVQWVKADPKVKYHVSFWAKASAPGSRFYIYFDNQDEVRAPISNTLPMGSTSLLANFPFPTEWTKYEGVIQLRDTTERVLFRSMFWNHTNGIRADQYLADFRIEPVIPSQDDVNTLLIDTAQNHSDILKAQADINTAQGDINRNNSAFQTWQKTINDQQKKWNDASTNATAALARFAITQSQWNELSKEASDANTKAIKAHSALFEGQNKWNEVAAAAIKTQADFATKQKEWNAVQKKVNDNFTDWQNAAKEMLTSTGKFQKLQTQFNSDQKLWNATQTLVNDKQKGINALNTKTDAAQNKAIEGLETATRLAFPQLNILPLVASGGNITQFGAGATHHSTDRPSGVDTGIYGSRSVGGVNGQLPASTVASSTTVVRGLTYRFVWWTKHMSGSNNGISLRVRSAPSSPLSTTVVQRFSTNGGETWTDSTMVMCSPTLNGGWSKWEALIEFKPGTTTFTPAFATNGATNQFQIYGLHASAYFPVQEQIDSAQNTAIKALNRFAVKQADWNKTSKEATDALREANAAQKELSAKRDHWEKGVNLALNNLQSTSAKFKQWTKASADASAAQAELEKKRGNWEKGANLAINNLQTTSTKFKEWTDGASTAIALNRELIGEQGLIQENQRLQMEALQEAVAEQTKLLYDELQSKPEIITVGDGQSYYDSRVTVNLVKSGSRVSKVTVRANGTWAGIVHVEADHGMSDGPGSTFMNYTPLLRKVNLVNTTSRDIVLTRNASVDHIGKVRITYWVYPGVVLTTKKTGSSLTVERGEWLTLHTFKATDTATFNAELQVGWDAAGRGPEYGVRITVNGTSVASDGPRNGVGPDFPWQDGYRQMSIKKTVVVQKGQTVRWEAHVSSGSTNERRIRNFNARATYMYRGLS